MAVARDLQSILKSFRNVGKGDNIHGVVSSDRINALQDAVKYLARGDHINAGVGIRKRVGQDGFTMLTVDRIRPRGVPDDFPWKISLVLNKDTNLFSVRVRPGTINSIIPSNMFDTSNNDIQLFGTYYVTLDCTTDGDSPTTAVVDYNSDVPPDPLGSEVGVAPSEFSLLLGMIVDTKIFQTTFDLLIAIPAPTIQTLKDNPVPGEPYYDINYTWNITGY